VRTLHYYDRIGLLKPSARTHAGARLYRSSDYARLQQIVTLKFIGFSLKEIRKLLGATNREWVTALRSQRRTLEAMRSRLDTAIHALSQAESHASQTQNPDWKVFLTITQNIVMQTNTDWTKKYYTDEARKELHQRTSLWSPELQKQVDAQWSQLFADIETAAKAGLDPASDAAKALLDRNNKLIESFTGGSPAIADGLQKLWSDVDNWPDSFKKTVFEPFAKQGETPAPGKTPSFLSPEADAFFQRVKQTAGKSCFS